MGLKKILVRILPPRLKRSIKSLSRIPLKFWVYNKKIRGRIISKVDIISGLREIGIKNGDTILVHSSLSSFGYVNNGPIEIIEALLDAVGKRGNVCMPAFGPLEDGKTFDVKKSPSGLGKITDIFWRLSQAKRSLSPTHSVACIGKDADYIINGHLVDETPFTKNSPYYKIMELGGKIVTLGSPFGASLTCVHLVEDKAKEIFPVKVYVDKPKEFIVIDQNGTKNIVFKRVHKPSINSIRVDGNPDIAEWFEDILIKRGCLKKTKVGEAVIRVYGVKCMAKILGEMLKEGKTLYKGYGSMEDF